MNLKELKELIDIFTAKDSIEELEVEKSGVRLRMRRSGSGNHVAHTVSSASGAAASAAPALSAAHATVPAQIAAESEGLVYVKSPIVGTFYKAATPTAEPFVSVGDAVEKGTVLCIIEAMKLMNEIESDVAGEITAIFVDNAQPVEYGERLFAIRPR
jgi:acetyl-CoA carboxylase biotin carboxyl carrier protein